MDRRPIAIFDSGLGGLTAAGELARLMPRENLIYFGDTGRVPYGVRSRETILKYARQDVAFLRSFAPKVIVVACGTVSTVALDTLRRENDIPIVGVVEPAGRAAAACTQNGKIGLMGTHASVRSGAYERVIASVRPDVEVLAEACPLLVPLVENGRIHPGDVVIETVVEEYLQPMQKAKVDTIVLGCTHYPLLKPVLSRQLGESVTLIDTGETCARKVVELLEKQGMTAPPERERGRRQYYVSDAPAGFASIASLFLGEEIEDAVEQVDIDRF